MTCSKQNRVNTPPHPPGRSKEARSSYLSVVCPLVYGDNAEMTNAATRGLHKPASGCRATRQRAVTVSVIRMAGDWNRNLWAKGTHIQPPSRTPLHERMPSWGAHCGRTCTMEGRMRDIWPRLKPDQRGDAASRHCGYVRESGTSALCLRNPCPVNRHQARGQPLSPNPAPGGRGCDASHRRGSHAAG